MRTYRSTRRVSFQSGQIRGTKRFNQVPHAVHPGMRPGVVCSQHAVPHRASHNGPATAVDVSRLSARCAGMTAPCPNVRSEPDKLRRNHQDERGIRRPSIRFRLDSRSALMPIHKSLGLLHIYLAGAAPNRSRQGLAVGPNATPQNRKSPVAAGISHRHGSKPGRRTMPRPMPGHPT